MSPETTAEVTMMAGGAAVEATQYHLYQRVIIHEPLHMDAAIWEARVAAQREKLIAAGRANLDGMLRFLRGTDCVANLIGPLYEVPDIQLGSRCVQIKVARACGGCPHCRASGRSVRHDLPLATPFPWSPPERVSGPGAQLLDDGNRVVITYASPFWRGSQRERRRFLESLAVLMKLSAIHNIIAPQGSGLDATELQKYCQGWPLFLSDQLQWPDLPPGPAIVLVPPEVSLRSQHLQSRRSDDARFLFVHVQAEAPDAPGVKLRERHTGRVLTLEQFQRQV
jgi:hypothetical protein